MHLTAVTDNLLYQKISQKLKLPFTLRSISINMALFHTIIMDDLISVLDESMGQTEKFLFWGIFWPYTRKTKSGSI